MAFIGRRTFEAKGARVRLRRALRPLRKVSERIETLFPFRTLTRRIVFLNLFALAVLVTGILYLDQFRAQLIDTKVQSLSTQGEIIAGAIADSAAADQGSVNQDAAPEEDFGITAGAVDNVFASLQFNLDPALAAPMLRRLIKPTGTRARIYDLQGTLILDSDTIYVRGQILRYDLPPPGGEDLDFITRIWRQARAWLWYPDLPKYRDIGSENGKAYPEVVSALVGTSTPIVRLNKRGGLVVSVAVPVRRMRAVLGVLLLSTRGGSIDDIVRAERLRILKFALFAAGVALVLSILLARTIAGPIQLLSAAAVRVRRTVGARARIPDYTYRPDEIGHLSRSLTDMTASLYQRLEDTERFAADVAHELKNPLTSLRSAAETLPLVKTDEARDELIAVIQHDVRRLDRLLSDIADASRLDAELAREGGRRVDMAGLLRTVVPAIEDMHRKRQIEVVLNIAKRPGRGRGYVVLGHDSRLGQVVTNLIENAISFSSDKGRVIVSLGRVGDEIEIVVEDDGPGIAPENLHKVFERFYTDRPTSQGFGNHSGLGLNICKQIIEAHGGRIWAENKTVSKANLRKGVATQTQSKPHGARFAARLPAA